MTAVPSTGCRIELGVNGSFLKVRPNILLFDFIFKNEDGTVTSLISREEYYARHSEQYVEETFGGSLPAFLAAFGTRKKLSEQEIDELQKVIDRMRG